MENVMSGAIPSKDLFMMCSALNTSAFRELPQGFHFRMCRPDELETWKEMLLDFPHTPEIHNEYMQIMTDYFNNVYAKKSDLFFQKCLFVCNNNDTPIGRGFIWKAYDKINTVHWYKVFKEYENRGIGRAILTAMMKGLKEEDYPVYLHTHPSSFRAIKLYSDFGFCLISNPVVGKRNNDLEECLPILEKFMPKNDFDNLKIVKAPQYFLDVSASSEIEEF
jgi:GNAT superfamily N-acetyltransferase